MSIATNEALLEVGLEDSFPASDPPSYMAGAAISGAPPRRPRGVRRKKDHAARAPSAKAGVGSPR